MRAARVERFEPARLRGGDLSAQLRDAVVVAALVIGIRRRAARRRFDQLVLDHARERAIHGADVGHGRIAAFLDVQDDPVAVALARGQAKQDVEFDRPERQVPGDYLAAWHIYASRM